MEELLEILNEIDDSIDYENETALIDDQLLDSFAIITLVSELEDAFDISIEASEMMPVNFNSAKAIWAMVQRLQPPVARYGCAYPYEPGKRETEG